MDAVEKSWCCSTRLLFFWFVFAGSLQLNDNITRGTMSDQRQQCTSPRTVRISTPAASAGRPPSLEQPGGSGIVRQILCEHSPLLPPTGISLSRSLLECGCVRV